MQAFKRKNSPDNDPVWGHILNGKMVDDRNDIQIFGDNESIKSILDKHAFFVSRQLDQYELVKLKISVVRN